MSDIEAENKNLKEEQSEVVHRPRSALRALAPKISAGMSSIPTPAMKIKSRIP